MKNPIAQPQPQCQIVGLFLKRFLASRERSHIPYQGTFEDFPFLKVGFVIVPCKVAVATVNGGIITGDKILSEDTASTSSNTGNKTHELLQFRFCTYSIKLGKTMYVCMYINIYIYTYLLHNPARRSFADPETHHSCTLVAFLARTCFVFS